MFARRGFVGAEVKVVEFDDRNKFCRYRGEHHNRYMDGLGRQVLYRH